MTSSRSLSLSTNVDDAVSLGRRVPSEPERGRAGAAGVFDRQESFGRIGDVDGIISATQNQMRQLSAAQTEFFLCRVDRHAVGRDVDRQIVADAAEVDDRAAVGVAEAVLAEAGGEVVGVRPVHAGKRVGARPAGNQSRRRRRR